MTKRRFIQFVTLLLLAVCVFRLAPVQAQQKKNDCGKPPRLAPPPKPSKEENSKPSKAKLQGNVAIEISEERDVISAKVVDPVSGAEADQLAALAKSMKFKPRPGCGVYKTVVYYRIGMS